MDRLVAMQAFVAVVNEGGFTRAADRLGVSPQLVSKYVSQLEQNLGVRLLSRTTRKVSLTEVGSLYLQRARQLLVELDDLESQVGDFRQQVRGTLRISAPVSFAITQMPRLLRDFQSAYPDVQIDMQLNDRKVDIVEEGFDIALRIGRLKTSSLIAKRLAPVRILLCASPEYLERYGRPEQPDDLLKHRYLHYSYTELDGPLSRVLNANAPTGRTVPLTSNNGDVLAEAAIAGAGIVIQPSFIVGPAIAAGKLERLLPEYEPASLALYAVVAHRQLMASKVRSFIDFVDGYFGTPPYWDDF